MSGSESSNLAGIVTAVSCSNAHRKRGNDNIQLHWQGQSTLVQPQLSHCEQHTGICTQVARFQYQTSCIYMYAAAMVNNNPLMNSSAKNGTHEG